MGDFRLPADFVQQIRDLRATLGALGVRVYRLDRPILSDVGNALSAVSTASESTFASWTGVSLTVPETGTYALWTGPIRIAVTAAVLTGARWSMANNSVNFGDFVRHVGTDQFDESTSSLYQHAALVAGDVLSLRYATNNQSANFSVPTIYARRIA